MDPPGFRGIRREAVPKVSIVIPCFNGQAYLAECLRSIVQLTGIAYEIVVVDDGSSEDIRAVVEEFSPAARYVWQPNQGPAVARNHGIQESTGEYVWFMDSDDRLLSADVLAEMLALFEKHPTVGLVHAPALAVDSHGRPFEVLRPSFTRGSYIRAERDELRNLLFGNYITTSATIVRRAVIDRVGLFSSEFIGPEDWDYWLRVAQVAGVGYVDEPLVAYRIHEGSITSRYTPERWLEMHVEILRRVFADPAVASRYGCLQHSINTHLCAATAAIAYSSRQMDSARQYARRALWESIYDRQAGLAACCLWIFFKSWLPDRSRALAKRARQSLRRGVTAGHLAALRSPTSQAGERLRSS